MDHLVKPRGLVESIYVREDTRVTLSRTMCQFDVFRKSMPSQNRLLIVYHY